MPTLSVLATRDPEALHVSGIAHLLESWADDTGESFIPIGRPRTQVKPATKVSIFPRPDTGPVVPLGPGAPDPVLADCSHEVYLMRHKPELWDSPGQIEPMLDYRAYLAEKYDVWDVDCQNCQRAIFVKDLHDTCPRCNGCTS